MRTVVLSYPSKNSRINIGGLALSQNPEIWIVSGLCYYYGPIPGEGRILKFSLNTEWRQE